MRICSILFSFFLLVFAIPHIINYQGKLIDTGGVGITDTVDMTFRLFNSADEGTLLWEETHHNVVVTQGLFSVLLGELVPFDTLSFARQYWLEVQIETETFSPRERFVAVPYAIRSSLADNLPIATMDTVQSYGGITISYTCGEEISFGDAVYLPGTLSGWSYRQPITIANGTPTSATNYQIRIKITSSNSSFWAHRQSVVGNDVRFTDTDGASLLKFWKEAFVDLDSAVFWVRVPNIPAMGTKMIYLYYGNPSASSGSDFDNTFTKDYGLDASQVALYHLDEGSGGNVQDASGNLNHGTVPLTASWGSVDGGQWDSRADVNFSTGSYLTVDAADEYVTVPHSSTLNLASTVTVEGWFKGSGSVALHSAFADELDNTSNISAQSQVTFTGGLVKIMGESSWYNSSWSYRCPITISNGGSALSDYQVLVTFDSASLISAGKMRSDCGDLRFTGSDGITVLSYWIESGVNSSSTKVWVKVNSVPNGSSTIYMYYGNSGASSASSSTNTFDFFDDFEDGVVDWTIGTAIESYQETGGCLQLIAKQNTWGQIYSTQQASKSKSLDVQAFVLEADIGWIGTTSDLAQIGVGFENSSGQYKFLTGPGDFWAGSDPAWYITTPTQSAGGGENSLPGSGRSLFKVIYDGTNYRLWIDGTLKATVADVAVGPIAKVVVMNTRYQTYAGKTAQYYNILLRKYSSPEPIATVGAEQSRQRSSGYIISNPISSTSWSAWQTFSANDSIPSGTHIKYSILDGTTGATLVDSTWNGADLSGISASSIKLKATFYANADSTLSPCLKSWGVNWTNLAPFAKGGAYGLGPFAGDTLAGYINGKVVRRSGFSSSSWNHCALTYDGTKMRLYLNGAKVDSVPLATSINLNTHPLTLGKNFSGSFDEIRIYNRALPDSEIVCHYERRRYLSATPGYSFGSEESGGSSGLRRASGTSEYASSHFLGFAMGSCAPRGAVPVRISGVASGFSGLTPGADYYLQDEPGGIGTSSGTYTKRVGTAIAPDRILISR